LVWLLEKLRVRDANYDTLCGVTSRAGSRRIALGQPVQESHRTKAPYRTMPDAQHPSIAAAAAMSRDSRPAWPVAAVLGVSVLILLLAAALAAAFSVARWDAQDRAAHAEADLSARVTQAAAAASELLEARLQWLALIALQSEGSALRGAGQAERLAAWLQQQGPASPSIAWVDANGLVRAASSSLRAGELVSERPWFSAAVRGPALSDDAGPAALAAPQASQATAWAVHAVAPLHDEQRRTAGVVVSALDCASFARHLARANGVDADESALPWALIGRDGRTRCAGPGFPADLSALAVTAPANGARTWWHQAADAPAMMLASHRLDGSAAVKRLAWQIVVAQPAPAAWLSAMAIGSRRTLLAATLAALLAMPFVMWLAHRIGSPLARLAASLDQARTRFDYEPTRIPVEGTRETAAVGEAARSMLEQISAQQVAVDASTTGYRELFELHPLPMWVVDEESLRFLEVNAAAARKYGWRRDEFLNMTVLDIRPPEARAALAAAFEDTRTQEHHAAVWQHRLRSGETIDVEIASRQLRWGGRAARIAAVMDVSSQRRASLLLQRQRRDLSQLAQQLMSTEETERRELAQLLHDRFSPTLYGAKLSLEALRARSVSIAEPSDLRSEVARVVAPIVQALDASIADTRSLMSDLRPPLLVEQGLAAALAHEVERRAQGEEGVRVVFTRGEHAAAPPLRHDVGLEYALFMIVHEALHNALLHAQAQLVTIGFDEDSERILLSVRDDGGGFDSEAAPPIGHLGLVGMQERARWIGAEFKIDSVLGAGTTVRVEWRRPARP
jgi:PAS domain S-box-containing protein